jgi:hypothetical protein
MDPKTAAILNLCDATGIRDVVTSDIAAMKASETYFTPKEVAKRYGVSLSSIKYWQKQGMLVPSLKIDSGTVRYTLEDLTAFENRYRKS